MDAMNGNTKLGKAIRSAVKELSTLNDMVGLCAGCWAARCVCCAA